MKIQRTSGRGARKLLVLTVMALVTAGALVGATAAANRTVTSAENENRGAGEARETENVAVSTANLLDLSTIDNGEFQHDGAIWPGGELVVLEDNLSDGVAIDMSVGGAGETLSDSRVYNGTVEASHDLGNAYVRASRDAEGSLLLYAAVERLGPTYGTDDSFIEFEFNQDHVQAIGVAVPLRGERTDGDLLVRMNLAVGGVGSVEFRRWDGEAFQTVETGLSLAGEGCHSMAPRYSYCDRSRAEGLAAGNAELYDAWGAPVATPAADRLLEVAVNVDELLGADVEFTSIQFRTPEDIILGSFRSMGRWGQQWRSGEGVNTGKVADSTPSEDGALSLDGRSAVDLVPNGGN